MYALTPLRQLRLQHGLRLSDVAAKAGTSLTRASYIERDVVEGRPEEVAALRDAILAISETSTKSAIERLSSWVAGGGA